MLLSSSPALLDWAVPNPAIIFHPSVFLPRAFLFLSSLALVWMVQSVVILEGKEAEKPKTKMWLVGFCRQLGKSFSQPKTREQQAGFAGPNWCKSKFHAALGCIRDERYNSTKSKTSN